MNNHLRASGILLPVSSLPSPCGIGTFGDAAYRWVDFLAEAGQKYWQVLPMGPTSWGDSPYQSFSAFAGNPYFIDLDRLCDRGLLEKSEYVPLRWGRKPDKVDYHALYLLREPVLRLAFSRFTERDALVAFRMQNIAWIEDYALYMAVKAKMDGRPWTDWDEDIRLRRPASVEHWRDLLREDIEYHIFTQYLFYSQWADLKAYANLAGVQIIGDIPIYVAMDSADTWAGGHMFLLDEEMRPIEVAGCPPDAFAADGQLWGNPLYRWDVLKADGYRWWLERLRACFSLYDLVRIDHFRGFESYYCIPAGSTTAAGGEWRKGPGMDFLGAVNREFGGGRIIAEDLGYLTDEVKNLLSESGYPGMKVLQFAFDSREESNYLPHNYTSHCVVYTGTHDNDTVLGWFDHAKPDDVELAMEYLGLASEEYGNWAFIRCAMASVADLCVIPMQDYLDLGSEGRFNVPSTVGGENWRWRLEPDAATDELAEEIARFVHIYER